MHIPEAQETSSKEVLYQHEHMRLTAVPEHLSEQQAMVDDGLYLDGAKGIEPINVHSHMLELGREAQEELTSRANAVSATLEAAVYHLAQDPDFFRQLGIIPSPDDANAHPCEAQAQELMAAPSIRQSSLIEFGRIDMFPVEDHEGKLSFRAIEANMRCVEGGSYASILQRKAAEFTEALDAPALPVESMLAIARDAYKALPPDHQTGAGEPQIGFVYWPTDRVKSVETPNIKRLLDEQDSEAQVAIGRPDNLTVQKNENGHLDVYLHDDNEQLTKVDVIYRNIGLHDFEWQDEAGTWQADQLADIIMHPDRYNCTVVPGARQGFAGYKSLFAMISDPTYSELLQSGPHGVSPEVLALAQETVGWSRMTTDLDPDGETYATLATMPEEFVIKHIAGAGGADVILGWSEESIREGAVKFDVNPNGDATEVWQRILEKSRHNGSYLAQQRIAYLEILDGKVIDVNPYITQGTYQGQLVSRIGDKHPINVKRGGGLVFIAPQGQET